MVHMNVLSLLAGVQCTILRPERSKYQNELTLILGPTRVLWGYPSEVPMIGLESLEQFAVDVGVAWYSWKLSCSYLHRTSHRTLCLSLSLSGF